MADYTAPTGYSYDPSASLQLQAEAQLAQQQYLRDQLNELQIPQLGFTATSDAIKNLIASGQLGLSQSDAALQYLLGGGQLGLQQQMGQQQGLQSAANAYSNEALQAMQLAASLQGPSNAFQQQAVLEGMNNAGLSRGVDAISGAYSLPTFQAPQATPQAASLGTLAQQFHDAPGSYAGMTPTQIAFMSAEQAMQNSPSYAGPTMQGANQLLYGPSYAAPAMNASGAMYNAASQFDNGVAAKGGNPVNVGIGSGFGPFTNYAAGSPTSGSPYSGGTGGGYFGSMAMQVPTYGAGYGGYGTPPSGSYGTGYATASASPTSAGHATSSSPSYAPGWVPGVGYVNNGMYPGGSMPGLEPGVGWVANTGYGSGGYYGAPQGSTYGSGSGGTGYGSGNTPYQTSADAYRAALPSLNQISSRNWMQLPTSTQQFLTSAYGAGGYSAQDVQEAVKNNLPQFSSPSFGLVGA